VNWRRNGVLCCLVAIAAAGCTAKKATSPPPTPSSTASSPAPTTSPPASPSPSPSPSASPSPAPSPVPPPAGARAKSITFVSLDQAWVLAQAGSTTVVLATTDRGVHWSEVGTIATPIGSATGDVSEIRFANTQDGWAYGPGLWATTNGGASWHAVTIPGGVEDLEAAGGIAWAATNPCTGGAGCATAQPGSLYRVTTGSDAWQKVAGVSLAGTSAEIAPQAAAVYVLSGTTFLHSSDGTTFTALASPCPSGFGLGSIAASTATNVEALCVGDPGAGSSTKDVFVSANAGATFTQIAQAPRGGQPTSIAAGSPTTIAIAAASGASWIYEATGTDATWATPLSLSDGGAGWGDLGFTDATHGVVIHGPGAGGPGTVYLTDNGGTSWGEVPLQQ
jgi:hypothetical protein